MNLTRSKKNTIVRFLYVDLTKEYEKMVENGSDTKRKKISARMLEEEISKLQQESGYPYIVNIDTVNESNPIKGKIVMSNLCSEILQVQEPSVINDEQEYVKLGRDISCNLGSTNIANLMKAPDFGRSVKTMVKALDGSFRRIKHQKRAFRSSRKRNGACHRTGGNGSSFLPCAKQNSLRFKRSPGIRFDVFHVAELIGRWLLQTKLRLRRSKKCS